MKRKDNVQKINHLMVLNPGGPMVQAFIVEAVRQYADDVLAAGEPEDNTRAWINPRAWYACAESIARELQNLEVAQ
jgi:hypothetical protein